MSVLGILIGLIVCAFVALPAIIGVLGILATIFAVGGGAAARNKVKNSEPPDFRF